MDKEIQPFLQPASFNNGIARDFQTKVIVEMISRCIKENKKISIDEILDCWFRVPHRHYIRYYSDDGDGMSYKYFDPYEKDKILANCRSIAEHRARIWFMANLGAAVIKGKLLVIPVIDIDETKHIENETR